MKPDIDPFTGTAEDVAAITAIYGDSVEREIASFELTRPSEAEMARRLAALIDVGYPVLTARLDGGLVGYAYASAYRPRPAYSGTVEDTVYVHRDHAGQGIGKALLSALITACTERGHAQMIAVIACEQASDAPDNMASTRLHRACGFRSAGRLRGIGRKLGRTLDTVLMQRSL